MNEDNGLHSKPNAVSTAKKLAKWAAGFGVLVGVGGAMKGSSTFIGKMLLLKPSKVKPVMVCCFYEMQKKI